MNSARYPWLKPLTDYGPLAAFLAGYATGDLMRATLALMVATGIAITLTLILERRLPWMAVVTAAIVGIFGGLTLWFHDETFIKMKPTIIELLFAAILLGGLPFDRIFLKPVFGSAWNLSDAGWRTLTLRFGLFFIALGLLNELVWRTQSTHVWVNFKVFGLMALTVVFTIAQIPLITRETIDDA